MSSGGRSAAETRRFKALVRTCIEEGLDDEQAATRLLLRIDDYRYLRGLVVADEIQSVPRDNPDAVFAEYRIRIEAGVRDLDELILESRMRRGPGSANMVVSAVKAKADLQDRVLTRAQDLGIIHREPQKSVFLGGVAVADMGLAQLRDFVVKKAQDAERMMTAGSTDYLEEGDGQVYFPDDDLSEVPEREKVSA